MAVEITEPGVYDMSDADYHADPVPGGSLSASGAKLLLPPSCPARFHHYRTHGRPPKAEFDLGHAAHREVLGVGADLELIDAEVWNTKAAKEAVAAARAAGKTPVKPSQMRQVAEMAAALRQHAIAGELLDPERMVAEQSVFWVDDETGVWRRARLDAITRPSSVEPMVIVDYKTCSAADLRHIERAMWDYGYAMQADWYIDAAENTPGIGVVMQFFFIFQEVDPPYLVSVVEPDAVALRVGRQRNRQAIETYRDCTETGLWPGHTGYDEIPLVSVPAWAAREYDPPTEEIL